MKNKLMITLLVLGVAAIAFAVPQYFNYQGILRDSAGDLQTGDFSMTFKIYNVESGGTAAYDSGATTVTVSNGLYNVELPANASIFNGDAKWLEVTVGSDTLAPRLKINSVAYAIRAENAVTAESATTADTADNADYATLSGTATNAGTVDDISANTSATANELLALDTNKQFKGMSISAEAAGNTFALFVDGKLGASGAVVGTGTIGGGNARVTVNNAAVTTNSIIFLTPASSSVIDAKFIKVETVSSGSFDVSTYDENNTTFAIPFNYLIIN